MKSGIESVRYSLFTIGILCLVMALGCTDHDHSGDTAKEEVDSHDHGEATGPHGGVILEVGSEVAHLEVIHHPEEEALDLYLMGVDGKTVIKADQPIRLNIKTEEGPKQITAAVLAEGDGDGFEAKDPAFAEHGLNGQVVILLNGKEYFVALPEHCNEHEHETDESHQ